MCESGFHVISHFRNDVILYYPTLEKKTGKRGHPKWFDGKIDFANLDLIRYKEYEVNKRKLYGVRTYEKALKKVRFLIRPVSDGREDRQMAVLFLYRRFDGWTRSSGVLQNLVPHGILL